MLLQAHCGHLPRQMLSVSMDRVNKHRINISLTIPSRCRSGAEAGQVLAGGIQEEAEEGVVVAQNLAGVVDGAVGAIRTRAIGSARPVRTPTGPGARIAICARARNHRVCW